jgi:hypothetical protein
MDESQSQHAMSEDDAQNLKWLTDEFGGRFGPEMFETIQTEYKKFLPGLRPVYRTESSVKKIVENILLCIHPSNERAISSGDETVAGDIASKNIMRKFYITLFLSKYYESLPGKPNYKKKLTENVGKIRELLFPILFESQTNSNAWLCDKMDELIEYGRSGFPEPPKTVLDEAESARLAVTKIIEERRMQQQMQSSDNQTMTLGMTPTFSSSSSSVLFREEGEEEQLDEKDVLRREIREAILDVERSGKFNLNDPSTHNLVLKEIFNMPRFISIISGDTPANRSKFDEISNIFYDEIPSLLGERQGVSPPVVFSPGIFTPRQLKGRDEAEKKGWNYGAKKRGGPDFFPGGSKKIKSKKNSKMRSKRRSNTRRRRRNSYK